jgi:Zn-dependent peptidase ImmA (M78 family)/transcriptional regulator with XRE-family HTH domain
MADTPDRRIGGAIGLLRQERGWSQRALAKVVGLDQSALSRVEAGKRRLAAEELDVIARALGVSPAVLLAGPREDLPAPSETSPSSLPPDSAVDASMLPDVGWSEAAPGAEIAAPRVERPVGGGDDSADLPLSLLGEPTDARGVRRRVDSLALQAAVEDADAIYQRLQAERAERGDAPTRTRHESDERLGSRPPERLAARLGAPAAPLQGRPPHAPAPAHRGAAPHPSRDALLPDQVEAVLAGWFALRAAASSPRDWEYAGARAVRASGKPLQQPGAHSPEHGVSPGTAGAGASVSPLVGQPWSRGTPRDRIARFWRQELHVDPDGPVPDLIPLLEDVAGIEVVVVRRERETPVCGCSVREGAAFIFVNAARPVVLQRFALAHALGHLALGHGDVVDERIDWGQGNAREGETNDFAEELLVPVAAVARWYDRRGDPAPDVETIVELANAFGVSFWAAMYRSRAARKLNPKRQAALTAELRRLEWRLLPRQAFLGGLKDTLTALTPDEVRSQGDSGPPEVLRVPARMRAWALRAVASGELSLERAAAALCMPAGELARALEGAGVE